jgi:hypothetical protein
MPDPTSTAAAPAPTRKIDGLMLFRAGVALWILGSPWLIGEGANASALSDTLVGLAALVVALGAERRPALRWLQAAAGLWLVFSSALLEPTELQRYNEILVGKLLLLSAPVTRDLFT